MYINSNSIYIANNARTYVTHVVYLLLNIFAYIFKRQPHKMVKHTPTIRRLSPTNYLSAFYHFEGLALKELTHCKLF